MYSTHYLRHIWQSWKRQDICHQKYPAKQKPLTQGQMDKLPNHAKHIPSKAQIANYPIIR